MFRFQANKSAPAYVKRTKVPLSCRARQIRQRDTGNAVDRCIDIRPAHEFAIAGLPLAGLPIGGTQERTPVLVVGKPVAILSATGFVLPPTAAPAPSPGLLFCGGPAGFVCISARGARRNPGRCEASLKLRRGPFGPEKTPAQPPSLWRANRGIGDPSMGLFTDQLTDQQLLPP